MDFKSLEATDDYTYFKKGVYALTRINLDYYKEEQMQRRLTKRMERLGLPGYRDYSRLLFQNKKELEAFVDYITINVTEFFRTPKHWQVLEQEILPQLINRFGPKLRIWSAGCSTGEEAYSLAMSMAKYVPLEDIHIIATDVDPSVLKKAQEGFYKEPSMAEVPEELRNRYFVEEGDGYRLVPELRKCVEFRQLNLLQAPYPEELHLLVCRNVLIYLTDEAKDMFFAKAKANLVAEGCLFLGSAEQIVYYKEEGYRKHSSSIYIKK